MVMVDLSIQYRYGVFSKFIDPLQQSPKKRVKIIAMSNVQ